MTQIDFRFTDTTGQQQVLQVTLTADSTWLVDVSIDGLPFRRVCHDWQSVERTLSWMRRHAHDATRERALAAC